VCRMGTADSEVEPKRALTTEGLEVASLDLHSRTYVGDGVAWLGECFGHYLVAWVLGSGG
jgi:hypothetical protein